VTDPNDPDEVAQRYESAIASMESAGLSVEGDLLVAPAADAIGDDIDAEVLSVLQASIDAVNAELLGSGEIALADLGLEDDGTGQAVALNTPESDGEVDEQSQDGDGGNDDA
jgi:hypothetical protein